VDFIMSPEYIQTNVSPESATVLRDGDQLDMHATSKHVIPYEQLQAREAVAAAQSIEHERPLLPHEIAALNTQNLTTMRGYDLAA
jgi:hypothetical protein